jgi:arsenate reductase-like glutaredoxin family protein
MCKKKKIAPVNEEEICRQKIWLEELEKLAKEQGFEIKTITIKRTKKIKKMEKAVRKYVLAIEKAHKNAGKSKLIFREQVFTEGEEESASAKLARALEAAGIKGGETIHVELPHKEKIIAFIEMVEEGNKKPARNNTPIKAATC